MKCKRVFPSESLDEKANELMVKRAYQGVKNWPTTLHDTDETPFNLRHGYMWGRISALDDR